MKRVINAKYHLLILAACVLLLGGAGQTALADVHFNEIYASHSGTDDREFIELIGTPSESLNNIMVLIVEGEGPVAGTIDQAWDLTGFSVPLDGYFVLGDTAVTTWDYDLGASNNIENGTQTFYLLNATSPATVLALVGTDLDADDDGIYDAGMEISTLGTILETVGMVDDDYPSFDVLYDSPTTIGPDGSYFPAGIWRDEDYPGDWCRNYFLDFDATANTTWPRTPGTGNLECPGACCFELPASGAHARGREADFVQSPASRCLDQDQGLYEVECNCPRGSRFLKDGLCEDFDPSCGG
jgi:hypothetical protein